MHLYVPVLYVRVPRIIRVYPQATRYLCVDLYVRVRVCRSVRLEKECISFIETVMVPIETVMVPIETVRVPIETVRI